MSSSLSAELSLFSARSKRWSFLLESLGYKRPGVLQRVDEVAVPSLRDVETLKTVSSMKSGITVGLRGNGNRCYLR